MLRLILAILVIYLSLQFIFRFLLPVIRATRQMKDQVRDFHGRMNEQNGSFGQPDPEPKRAPTKDGDYIDYEEVK